MVAQNSPKYERMVAQNGLKYERMVARNGRRRGRIVVLNSRKYGGEMDELWKDCGRKVEKYLLYIKKCSKKYCFFCFSQFLSVTLQSEYIVIV